MVFEIRYEPLSRGWRTDLRSIDDVARLLGPREDRLTILWAPRSDRRAEIVFEGSEAEALRICRENPAHFDRARVAWEQRPRPDFSSFDFGFRPAHDASSPLVYQDVDAAGQAEIVRIEGDGPERLYWRLLVHQSGEVRIDTNVDGMSLPDALGHRTPSELLSLPGLIEALGGMDIEEQPTDWPLHQPLSFVALVKLLDRLFDIYRSPFVPSRCRPNVPPCPALLGLVAPSKHLTAEGLERIRYSSTHYPQLHELMTARARHWLAHGEFVPTKDFPIDLRRLFGGFDFEFQPATYWGESALPVDRYHVDGNEAQDDEVEIVCLTISWYAENDSGTDFSFTAHRDPDFYAIADDEDEDEEEVETDLIVYRTVCADDNGYWAEDNVYSSSDPLTFKELLLVLEGLDVHGQVDSHGAQELGATLSMSSSVYPRLAEFFDLQSAIVEDFGRWVSVNEIVAATDQATSV